MDKQWTKFGYRQTLDKARIFVEEHQNPNFVQPKNCRPKSVMLRSSELKNKAELLRSEVAGRQWPTAHPVTTQVCRSGRCMRAPSLSFPPPTNLSILQPSTVTAWMTSIINQPIIGLRAGTGRAMARGRWQTSLFQQFHFNRPLIPIFILSGCPLHSILSL